MSDGALDMRNSPPASRIRSRPATPWPATWNIGRVSPMIHDSVRSSRTRVMSASPSPMRRASGCCAAGSRALTIAMKTRLSTPSTISSAVSVASATRPSEVRKAPMRSAYYRRPRARLTLAARPVPRDPERLVVAAVVPGRLVVALDPEAVGRPLPRHPRVVRGSLRHPLVVPVAVLPAAARRDDDDLGRHHDRRAAVAAEAALVLVVLPAEILDVVEAPARTGERPVGQHVLGAPLPGFHHGQRHGHGGDQQREHERTSHSRPPVGDVGGSP